LSDRLPVWREGVFHVKHEGWGEAVHDLGLGDLPAGAERALDRFADLLRDRAAPMGMVAPGDVPVLRERHLLDSLRAAPLLARAERVCDMGSGAGLPGIPLAIVLPRTSFTLAEVRRNRAEFLVAATSELQLANVEVYGRRLETLRRTFDVATARAFAPPERAWAAARRILEPGGRLLYWAGERFDADMDTPPDARLELFRTPALARAGPLAIMTA
jgi:16S rRNA (guanine527-N7)-methyltransferase